MSLRLYPTTNGVSNLTVGISTTSGGWYAPQTHSCNELAINKADQSGTGLYAKSAVMPDEPDEGRTYYINTFLYRLTRDTYITGTIDICIPSSGFGFTPADMNAHWCLHVYVNQGTSGTLRGTVLTNYSEPTGATNVLPGATITANQLITPTSLTPLWAYAGDYLVVELGAVQWAHTQETQTTVYFGTKNDSGVVMSDLAAGDTLTYPVGSDTDASAWIEFSDLTGEVDYGTGENFGPLVWAEWEHQGTRRYWAPVDLPDPSTYYGGYKEPKLLRPGVITRALSDEDGQYQAQRFDVTVTDIDYTVRTILGQSDDTRIIINTPLVMRMIADEDRRLLKVPRTVAIGVVRDCQFG